MKSGYPLMSSVATKGMMMVAFAALVPNRHTAVMGFVFSPSPHLPSYFSSFSSFSSHLRPGVAIVDYATTSTRLRESSSETTPTTPATKKGGGNGSNGMTNAPPPPPSLNGKVILPMKSLLAGLGQHRVAAVYAILENYDRGTGGDGWANVVHVGVTRDLGSDVADFRMREEEAAATKAVSTAKKTTYHVRALSFSYPQKSVMMDFADTWRTRAQEAREIIGKDEANEDDYEDDITDDDDEDMDDDDLDDYLQLMAESRAAVSSTSSIPPSPPLFVDDTRSSGVSGGGGGSATTSSTTSRDGVVVSPFEKNDLRVDHRDYESTSEHDESAKQSSSPVDAGIPLPLELTVENVDAVLDEVRPYLISDGGNVSVRGVDDKVLEGEEGGGAPMPRNVYLLLEGACGSCASSTVTMKMGIERVLREKFGDALGEVLQVDPSSSSTDSIEGGKAKELTMEAVRAEVDRMSQAIIAMGGVVRIEDVDPEFGVVTIDYRGPNRVRRGLELALLDVEYVRHVKFVSS